ncbi:hypothetical protein JOQ06_013296, partial [Pogonophryne albipinna]
MAKRKKDDDYRAFQAAWTEEFSFVERAGSARETAGKGHARSYSGECRRVSSNYVCEPSKEALCAQTCGQELGEVMSLVIRVVNFIVARALNNRQFKALLEEVGNHYPGLLLHSNVRWLSREKVLSRFAACLSEIRTFLEMKGVKHPELDNTDWLLQFHYLVDITGHLNQLN